LLSISALGTLSFSDQNLTSPALHALYSPAGITIFYSHNPNVVELAIPTANLLAVIKAQAEAINNPNITIHSTAGSAFLDETNGNTDFHIRLVIDLNAHSGGIATDAHCSVDIKFAIPASTLDQLSVQVENLDGPNCSVSNDLLRPLVMDQIKQLSLKLPSDQFTKALIPADEIEKIKKIPGLGIVLQYALAQGRYCRDFRSNSAVCLIIGMPPNSTKAYFDYLIEHTAVISEGVPDLSSFEDRRAALRAVAPRSPSPSGQFPAERSGNGYSTGDMSLFGGLLCLSGEADGCDLVKRSQSANGQFWRSPANVNDSPTKDYSPFSGDQINGVFAYLAKTGDAKGAAEYLRFLRNNTESSVSDTGYKSCFEFIGNHNCLLQGEEWHWLDLLAGRMGIASELPADSADAFKRYGYTLDFLEWRGGLTPLEGDAYQLHLAAVQVYLNQKLGIEDPMLNRAAQIIAARQPDNPFYNYLALGKDKRVERLLRAKCFSEVAPEKRTDWAWQRDETESAWMRSDGWDCVFMLNNMLDDSAPIFSQQDAQSKVARSQQVTISVQCKTANTGQFGEGKSCSADSPLYSARPGFAFDQQQAKMFVDEAVGDRPPASSCRMSWGGYVEVIPGTGIKRPTTVILTAMADSLAGIGHANGGSGRTSCRLQVPERGLTSK
jgi:hypothetical protein